MKKILLVGTGYMAKEYFRVLKDLDVEIMVVGRGQTGADEFNKEFGILPKTGGVENYLKTCSERFDGAIVAVGVDVLKRTAIEVLRLNCSRILLEKPGGLNFDEILELHEMSSNIDSQIFIAYNRRFYSSVNQAMKLIEEDGGILSGNFEFTEWSHVIQELKVSDNIKNNYFLANSSHVLDLAFYLMGKPKDLSSFADGDCGWHKPSIFAGSGITDRNVLFSYSANWESAGRWGIELLTAKRKLVLRPMEKLFEQKLGELTVNEVNVNEALIDDKYKPGVFKEVQAFLSEGSDSPLKTLDEQVQDIIWLNQILNGKKDSM